MIEIVERGIIPKFQVKCNSCKSVLTFNGTDTYIHDGIDMSGDPNSSVWIKCPVCKNDILLWAMGYYDCYENETYKRIE